MTTAAALLIAALAAYCVALPRVAATVAGVVAVVAWFDIAASSPLAFAAVIGAVFAVAAVVDGSGVAPTAPGYLARAAAAPTPAPRRAAIRFLPPVWEVVRTTRVDLAIADVVAAALDAATAAGDAAAWAALEIDRLVECRARAKASRHRTRAAEYARRIAVLRAALH